MKRNVSRIGIIRNLSIVLLVFLLLFVAFSLLKMWDKNQDTFQERDEDVSVQTKIEYNGKTYLQNPDIKTIVVMGLDKFSTEYSDIDYMNDMQADFIMVLAVNEKEKKYSIVHVNRDTMAEMDMLGIAGVKIGTKTAQIALSHNYGNGKEASARNTVKAVSTLLLDTKLPYYVSMTMDCVPIINDSVGGVEVLVEDDFSTVDDTLVKGQTVLLKGEHSLKFVRARHGVEDSTNLNRMKRQRQYVAEFTKKVKDAVSNDADYALKLNKELSDKVITNLGASAVNTVFKNLCDFELDGIYAIEGTAEVKDELMEFYPDEQKLTELVVDVFYKEK